jgi:outer membrane protein OmpU
MNIKKIGLTALAGSLVAMSAYAGELSLSGTADISYSEYTGNENGAARNTQTLRDANNNWGVTQAITASGSGELDNGWVVSISHALTATGDANSTSTLSLDFGDGGVLSYSDGDISGGLHSLDDITPTAWEEATDGPVNERQAGMFSGAGFSYTNTFAGAVVSVQYSDNMSGAADNDEGTVSTTGTDNGVSHSIGVTYPVGDSGFTIYGGLGVEGQADGNDLDHDTVGFKFAMGPLTFGAQRNTEDDSAAASPLDLETNIIGLSYLVNENLSISYGRHETTADGAIDQEIDSIQAAYSMGGITVAAQNSQGDNVRNVVGATSEKTEIRVSFAF